MSVQTLVDKIAALIQTNGESGVQTGVVTGTGITVGGHSYAYDVAVDVDFSDGDTVFVLFNDGHTRAVVIGK